MEIPDISIPKIEVPQINIPTHIPFQVLNVPPPSIKLPGCVRYHRDASPKNTALYDDDPRVCLLYTSEAADDLLV